MSSGDFRWGVVGQGEGELPIALPPSSGPVTAALAGGSNPQARPQPAISPGRCCDPTHGRWETIIYSHSYHDTLMGCGPQTEKRDGGG